MDTIFYCWCFVGRGTILDPRELRDEGLHVIWPWDKLYLYSLRLQSTTSTYNAITKDGVSVNVQISIRGFSCCTTTSLCFTNLLARITWLQSWTRRSAVDAREVIAQYTAQEVYTSRESLSKEKFERTRKRA